MQDVKPHFSWLCHGRRSGLRSGLRSGSIRIKLGGTLGVIASAFTNVAYR